VRRGLRLRRPSQFHRPFGTWSVILNAKPGAGASGCAQGLVSILNLSSLVCILS
jgi:hypothetical protein